MSTNRFQQYRPNSYTSQFVPTPLNGELMMGALKVNQGRFDKNLEQGNSFMPEIDYHPIDRAHADRLNNKYTEEASQYVDQLMESGDNSKFRRDFAGFSSRYNKDKATGEVAQLAQRKASIAAELEAIDEWTKKHPDVGMRAKDKYLRGLNSNLTDANGDPIYSLGSASLFEQVDLSAKLDKVLDNISGPDGGFISGIGNVKLSDNGQYLVYSNGNWQAISEQRVLDAVGGMFRDDPEVSGYMQNMNQHFGVDLTDNVNNMMRGAMSAKSFHRTAGSDYHMNNRDYIDGSGVQLPPDQQAAFKGAQTENVGTTAYSPEVTSAQTDQKNSDKQVIAQTTKSINESKAALNDYMADNGLMVGQSGLRSSVGMENNTDAYDAVSLYYATKRDLGEMNPNISKEEQDAIVYAEMQKNPLFDKYSDIIGINEISNLAADTRVATHFQTIQSLENQRIDAEESLQSIINTQLETNDYLKQQFYKTSDNSQADIKGSFEEMLNSHNENNEHSVESFNTISENKEMLLNLPFSGDFINIVKRGGETSTGQFFNSSGQTQEFINRIGPMLYGSEWNSIDKEYSQLKKISDKKKKDPDYVLHGKDLKLYNKYGRDIKNHPGNDVRAVSGKLRDITSDVYLDQKNKGLFTEEEQDKTIRLAMNTAAASPGGKAAAADFNLVQDAIVENHSNIRTMGGETITDFILSGIDDYADYSAQDMKEDGVTLEITGIGDPRLGFNNLGKQDWANLRVNYVLHDSSNNDPAIKGTTDVRVNNKDVDGLNDVAERAWLEQNSSYDGVSYVFKDDESDRLNISKGLEGMSQRSETKTQIDRIKKQNKKTTYSVQVNDPSLNAAGVYKIPLSYKGKIFTYQHPFTGQEVTLQNPNNPDADAFDQLSKEIGLLMFQATTGQQSRR